MRTIVTILTLLSLAACGPSRKTSTRDTNTSRLAATSDSSGSSSLRMSDTYRERRDTAVGIPAKELSQNLTLKDLEPAYTADGTPVTRTHTKSEGGLTSTLTIHPDGSVDVKCKSDSLTLVIRALDSMVTHLRDSFTSAQQRAVSAITVTSMNQEEVKVYDLWYYIKWVIVFAIATGVIFIIIKRFV